MMTKIDQPSFLPGTAQSATFMDLPLDTDLTNREAAILGIPFDCGQHQTRIGARGGPRAIREQSSLVRRYQPPFADFDPLTELNVCDMGDAMVTSAMLEPAMVAIETAVSYIVQSNTIPVTLGGDGAVTLPQLRAVHKKYTDLVVVHLDAHTDTSRSVGNGFNDLYNTATTFTRAREEGLVAPDLSFHIGARGTLPLQGTLHHTKDQGYQIIDGDSLFERGFDDVAHEIHETIDDRPIYLCIDMDFFDPSCAPGVCTPTWGGPTSREGLSFLRKLVGLNIVAFDINTVSPAQDVGGMTAFLAGTVVMECVTLAAIANRQKPIN
jgi:agmatinase